MSEGTDSRMIILIFGKPKVGKTVLATQFPNLTFIDLDDSLGSVRALKKAEGLNFDFRVFDIKDKQTEDLEFLELCGKSFGKMNQWRKTKKLIESLEMSKDETVVIDNLSRLGEALIADIRQVTGQEQLRIQDWMTFTNEIQQFLDTIRKFPCNVIMIAHEDVTKDKLTGELEKMILMPTKIRHRVPSVVTDFFYMKTDVTGPKNARKVVRKLQAIPDPSVATGSRALIPDMDNPSFDKMKSYIETMLGRELPESTWTPKT